MSKFLKFPVILIIVFGIIGTAFYFGGFFKKNNKEETEKKAEIPSLITVDNPKINQEITSPLIIEGRAVGNWYFEASFPVQLFDDNGFLLGQKPAQAKSDWMTTDFVPFQIEFPFSAPSTQKGILVLKKDNPSGLPEYDKKLEIPVLFPEIPSVSGEKMTLKIFLSDSNFVNEPYFDCQKTVAVEREVPKTETPAKSALEALLRGAEAEEISRGYITTINPGVRLKKITIEDNVARAEFNEQLEFQVGGSCRVAAIRAQIRDTLKQFPAIKDAVIIINGRTEDILQP